MEPKKIKKLVLKQETIANLSENEMAHEKGGTFPTFCLLCTNPKYCTPAICNINYGGDGDDGGGDCDCTGCPMYFQCFDRSYGRGEKRCPLGRI